MNLGQGQFNLSSALLSYKKQLSPKFFKVLVGVC